MKLRVGLIGLGDTWQNRHSPALRALADRFEVRAVCDEVEHRAEQAAEDFGATALDSYRALARREDVDAVLVLSPQWYGHLPILAACDSGKAVYCGTGLQMTPDEAQLVKRRVEEAGIAFVAEFPRRGAAATVRLKELIATRLGPPTILFCHRRMAAKRLRNHGPGEKPLFSTTRELVELVDWCRYVIGRPPARVTGLIHRSETSGEADYQMMSLDFSDRDCPGTGPVAQISCGRYLPAVWEEAITYRPLAALQVCCQNGVAFVDLPATLVWFDEAGRHQESLDSERPVGEQLLANFHCAVTSLIRKASDLEDAYQALRIVEEARRSHQEGCRIELS